MSLTVPCRDSSQKVSNLRLIVTSDTHNYHDQLEVPAGDVFIHCGDFTKKGTLAELAAFNVWLQKLPHARKFVIAGNHDTGFLCEIFKQPNVASLLSAATYLEAETVLLVDEVRLHGVSWHKRSSSAKVLVPDGIDILVTHEPPLGVLDGCHRIGSPDLSTALSTATQSGHGPRLHVFGHVHECFGSTQSAGIWSVNAAAANAGMVSRSLVNGCVIIDFHYNKKS